MKEDLSFFYKVVRNALILGGLMLVATYSTNTLNYALCKPVIVFILGYVLTEMARHFGIMPKNKRGEATLIF